MRTGQLGRAVAMIVGMALIVAAGRLLPVCSTGIGGSCTDVSVRSGIVGATFVLVGSILAVVALWGLEKHRNGDD